MAGETSSHGGKIVYTKSGGSAKTLQIEAWKRTPTPRVAEVPHSGTAGRNRRAIVLRDDKFDFTVIWDASSGETPEAVGLTTGTEGVADFHVGSSALKYAAVPIIITAGPIVTGCDQNGVVKAEVEAYVQGSSSAWGEALS